MISARSKNVLASALLLCEVTVAADLRVPDDFGTIQEAVNSAVAGDRVVVEAGTYTGTGNRDIDPLGKAITILGESGAAATILDCQGQASEFHRGFAIFSGASSLIIDGFTIRNGYHSYGGGVAVDFAASPTLRNCDIENCTADYGAGMTLYGGSCTVSDCTLRNNVATVDAGGIYHGGGNLSTVTHCVIEDNTAGYGAVLARDSSPIYIGCSIRNNVSLSGTGGLFCDFDADVRMEGCLISGNVGFGFAGGVSANTLCDLNITNTIIAGNVALSSAAISLGDGATLTLSNSTVADNACVFDAATNLFGSSVLTVSNSIFHGNFPTEFIVFGGTLDVTYSNVDGGLSGDGNIDADPAFVNPAGSDYRLASSSPCIDAGDNAAVPTDILDLDGDGDLLEPLPLDFDRQARFLDAPQTTDTGIGTPPIVDMGAFEYYFGEDCNGDGVPDLDEIASGADPDCNSNGIPDDCDITDGFSEDCSGNGVPDECESDCNGNNAADSCDLGDGSSLDCNADQVPDECQLNPDCNVNEIPDACDIADGGSEDCSGNGVPDECEPDCDGNGSADSCDIAFCPGGDNSCDDCNNNGTPDGCDIDSGGSSDDDGDGVPDDCSFWVADSGSWSNPTNWDPPIVPDNDETQSQFFNVIIDGEQADVTLDIDAVIDSLVLDEGAVLNITLGDLGVASPNGLLINGDCSIGPGRKVEALSPFTLDGLQPLRLDDPTARIASSSAGNTITILGSIAGHGVLDADFLNLNQIVADRPDSTLVVTGTLPKINNGLMRVDPDSIMLITDTVITGQGSIAVSDGLLALVPGENGVLVEATDLDASRDAIVEVSGDAFLKLTGTAEISDGASYLASVTGSSAILTVLNLLIFDGEESSSGGRVILDGSMSLDASNQINLFGYCFSGARGCTPPVWKVIDDATAECSSLDVEAGLVQVAGSASIHVGGVFTLLSGGVYQADPDRVGDSFASLTSGSVFILSNSEGAGQMTIEEEMNLNIDGDFTVNGLFGCEFAGPRGCTPPVWKVTGNASCEIGGDVIIDAAAVVYDSTQPLRLSGDFDNRSTLDAEFDWTNGAVTIAGIGILPQTLEAAGEDLGDSPSGLDVNFALGTLELSEGVSLDLVDDHDNQLDGQETCEALYVDALILREGATLRTFGCRIYYRSLDNQGTILDGADVIPITSLCEGDANGNGEVDPLDTGFVLSRFDCPVGAGDPDCDAADVNANGVVDPLDVGFVLSRLGLCL